MACKKVEVSQYTCDLDACGDIAYYPSWAEARIDGWTTATVNRTQEHYCCDVCREMAHRTRGQG